jgi:thiol:disulfide interchange protein DsbD
MMQLRSFFVIAVLILTSAFYVAGQTPEKISPPATASRIDFSATLGAVDPFSDSNIEEPKELSVRRGEVLVLRIQGTPKTGFHTYPITQRTENQDENGLSKITFKNNPVFSPIYPLKESEPEWKEEGVLGYFLEFEKPFTWTQEIYIQPDATLGKTELNFSIKLQVCDSKCVWGEHLFSIPVSVSKSDPLETSEELKQRLAIKEDAPKIVADPKSSNPKGNKQQTNTDNSKNGTEGLLAFALQGMFWGAISLVTPCVFPMIPITVSYFLKQSEKTNHRPVAMAVVYSLTIVIVLTIAAVALLSFFRLLSVHPAMNFGLGCLFVFFSLSLLGMYEIELPSGLAHFTSSKQGQGGMVGTIFMALTFTIVSFACVAPFLGGFGGTASGSNLTFLHRLLGGFAFSVTFASPFFLLALFPGMLKKLPKSGNWLNSVKVVMGFLELAAAIKFFRAGELVLFPEPLIFTYDFSMAITVIIALCCGLYLLGFLQLPHDMPSEHTSVPGVVLGCLFLGFGLYLTPALLKLKEDGSRLRPSGMIFAWVDSFLLPEENDDLPFIGDLNRGLEEAKKQNKMVFIDFTGVTCTNCKINEANVFPMKDVRELLKKFVLVQLYTDRVPDKLYSPEERSAFQGSATKQRADANKNLDFQKLKFNTEQLPLYVVVKPDANGFVEVARYDEGKINDVSAFVKFLRSGLIGK